MSTGQGNAKILQMNSNERFSAVRGHRGAQTKLHDAAPQCWATAT